jgi:hypothetical protein
MPTKLKPTAKLKAAKIKLKQIVAAARAAGAEVTISFGDNQMPMRMPNDPPDVTLLLDESERCTVLGNRWLKAPKPNPIAAGLCLSNGWAYALAAAWLRCKLRCELEPEEKRQWIPNVSKSKTK